jgi:hypothetical protein
MTFTVIVKVYEHNKPDVARTYTFDDAHAIATIITNLIKEFVTKSDVITAYKSNIDNFVQLASTNNITITSLDLGLFPIINYYIPQKINIIAVNSLYETVP